MKTSFLNRRKLPLVVEPEGGDFESSQEALVRLCRARRDFLHGKILEHGALLLRGFSVSSSAEFERIVREFSGKHLLDYAGGVSPRVKLGGVVYTSTEYAPHYTLSLHNELSYTYRWPEHLYFLCVTPSEQGGETPVGDSRAILKSIDPEVVRRFKSKKIRYDRNLQGEAGSGFSWQDAFETDDQTIVENYCRDGDIKFKWKADGGLWLSEIRPATATHPRTGEEVWFNQADGFHPSQIDRETYQALMSSMKEEDLRLNAYFGDGTPIDLTALDHVREVMRNETVLFPWHAGDILILDNMLTAHGRMPFTGRRKILLAMT